MWRMRTKRERDEEGGKNRRAEGGGKEEGREGRDALDESMAELEGKFCLNAGNNKWF